MNSLSIQDAMQNGKEGVILDQSIEVPSLSSSSNICQNEVTVGDGASLIIMEDMMLEEAINGCSGCENATPEGANNSSNNICQNEATVGDGASLIIMEDMTLGKSINGSSDCEHAPPEGVNNLKVNMDEVSFNNVVDIQEKNVEVARSAPPTDIMNKVCDLLDTEENFNGTCAEENKTPYDVSGLGTSNTEVAERRLDTLGITTPSSSQTNVLNDVIIQSRNEDVKHSFTRVPSSRRKLIVLDVNGLLADIVPAAYVSDKYEPDTIISGKAVFKRPFCDEFLKFCFQRFSVGIWSSRIKRNVNSVVDFLMGEVRHNLLFCWDQSHCTVTGYNTVENSNKPLVLKELKKLWEKFEPDLPWKRGEYNESNTLLLDDSPYKALCNPPNTAIFPRTYQYRDDKDNSLGPGGDLYIYLDGLAEAADVQTYVKQNRFGQEPITEEDASWSFYLKVKESSLSISSQPLKSSMQNVGSQTDMTSIGATKSEDFIDCKFEGQELSMVDSSRDVLQVTNASKAVEGDFKSLKQDDPKSMSGMSKMDEFGELPRENTSERAFGDSPSCISRSRKGGRSQSRSRSPVRGRRWNRSRSPGQRMSSWGGRDRHGQSRSLSHERWRSRSRSPSYRCGHEFDRDNMRRDKGRSQECFAFMRGNCYRGETCRYLHHGSDKNDSSRPYRGRQNYQDVLASSKSSEKCRNFMRGKCYKGAFCQYLHEESDKIDESSSYWSKQQYQDVSASSKSSEKCRNFMRGKCYRGAFCRYLHEEFDKIDESSSYWSKQQYQGTLSAKSSDIYWKTETIPPERSVHEHSEQETQNLDQDIPVEAWKGKKEALGHYPTQLWDKTRRGKALFEKCRNFMRGKCYKGEYCRYLHEEADKIDGSTSYCTKQQYQNVIPSAKTSDIYREVETTVPDRSVHEHSGWESQNLDQDILKVDRKCMKEECCNFKRGTCYRGAFCRYLHQESDEMHRSRFYWSQNQYQDRPPSSKSCDINMETETIIPEIPVHDQGEDGTQDLDQEILTTVERKGMKEELGDFTSQLGDKMRRDKASLEVCRKFMQGRCHRGASCRYLHPDSEKIGRSRSYWTEQQCQVIPPSSKTSDIYVEAESIPLERSVHEQGECDTQSLDQYGLVMEERKSMKEEISNFTPQLCEKMTGGKVPCRHFMRGNCFRGASCWFQHPELDKIDTSRSSSSKQQYQECRDFVRGKCSRGNYCRYLHHEFDQTDRSITYRSEKHYQNASFSSRVSDFDGEIESTPHERSVHEQDEPKTEDLKLHFPEMDEQKCKKELGESTSQLCDGQNPLEPSVVPLVDAGDEKVRDDVANYIPASNEISVIQQTLVHSSPQVIQNGHLTQQIE